MISLLIFGRETSEIYNRIQFFRDVAGYYEDKYIIQMGGPGKIVEQNQSRKEYVKYDLIRQSYIKYGYIKY